MDVIASKLGFFRDFLPGNICSDVSFDSIRQIQEEFCPEASRQAALINIVMALPQPCILIEASLALRKADEARASQMLLERGSQQPLPELRAVRVTINDAAREIGIRFHRNWRVPADSVISRIFVEGGYAEGAEDLNWWVTSGGSGLGACPVVVKAKKNWNSVQALLIPVV
jgi:hypothetical protein